MPLPTRIRAAAAIAVVPLVLAGCGGGNSASTTLPDPGVTGLAPLPAQTAAGDPMAGMPGMGEASASPSATPAGTVVHIDLVAGRPKVRPTAILKVKSGDTISIVATADKNFSATRPYEIHVHGFNYLLELPPGQTVTKTFVANEPKGTYEVEVENTSFLLFRLQIS